MEAHRLADEQERDYAVAVSGWNPDAIDWGQLRDPITDARMSVLKYAWLTGYAIGSQGMFLEDFGLERVDQDDASLLEALRCGYRKALQDRDRS